MKTAEFPPITAPADSVASLPTLLVVDDDDAARASLARVIEHRGYGVQAVATGQQALDALAASAPALVLLDRTLTDMDGLAVLRAIRERHSPGELPVIMVTGVGESDAVVEALELGANDYLSKPLDVPVAMARIRTQLARQEAEKALLESQERYALAIRAANDGIFDWRLDTNEGHFSPRWRAVLGCDEADAASLDTWFSRVHPDDLPALRTNLDEHLSGKADHFEMEHRVQGSGDGYRWVLARAVAVRDESGRAVRLAGSLSDITEGKVADALTGLPNRVLLMDRLSRLIGHSHRTPGYQVVVMFIDLDRFKMINDSLGHHVGDELLIQASGRLDGCVRSTDTVARIGTSNLPGSTVGRVGGDEFVVVLGGTSQAVGAATVAERLHAAFAQKFEVCGHDVFVSLSVGIAVSSPHTERGEDLLREADTAMYRAKAAGPARTEFFKSDMRMEARVELETETEMRLALERREFDLLYQPIVDLDTGETLTLEALLNWRRARSRPGSAASLIAVAERTGLIVPLGYWVLEQASADLVKLTARYPELASVTVAVNLSAKQLAVPDLAGAFSGIVGSIGLDPTRVEFELTESCVMTDPGAAQRTLEALRLCGFRLSIDDFGTGHSSLSYVHRLPIERLKVDRSFLSRERGLREADGVIRAIVDLGHHLGMGVVAEGVETGADVDRVRTLGCNMAQGYYFAVPQRLDRVAAAVREVRSKVPALAPH